MENVTDVFISPTNRDVIVLQSEDGDGCQNPDMMIPVYKVAYIVPEDNYTQIEKERNYAAASESLQTQDQDG